MENVPSVFLFIMIVGFFLSKHRRPVPRYRERPSDSGFVFWSPSGFVLRSGSGLVSAALFCLNFFLVRRRCLVVAVLSPIQQLHAID